MSEKASKLVLNKVTFGSILERRRQLDKKFNIYLLTI